MINITQSNNNWVVHELELLLANWALGTLGGHAMSGDQAPAFARWIRKHLSPVELVQFVLGEHEPRTVLLNDADFDSLIEAVEELPLASELTWVPWKFAGEFYVKGLAQIRSVLTETAADEFSKKSAKYAAKLDDPDLPLVDGLELVRDWIGQVGLLKVAMGFHDLLPRPQGKWPTPSNPLEEGESLPTARMSGRRDPVTSPTGPDGHSTRRTIVYAKEAIHELGLDRLKRPDNALQRLMERGDLPHTKINGKLAFRRGDVERLIEHGSRRSRLGRPPGSRNQPHHGT